MRYLILFLSVICSLYAKTPICDPLSLHGMPSKMMVKQPALLIFHNLSVYSLFLTHQGKTTWSSLIAPHHWSILFLKQRSLKLSCVESQPGHEQIVPCHGKISVCQRVLHPVTFKNTKWLLENSPKPLMPPV